MFGSTGTDTRWHGARVLERDWSEISNDGKASVGPISSELTDPVVSDCREGVLGVGHGERGGNVFRT